MTSKINYTSLHSLKTTGREEVSAVVIRRCNYYKRERKSVFNYFELIDLLCEKEKLDVFFVIFFFYT